MTLKQQLNEAKQNLINNGWEYKFTKLSDVLTDDEAGIVLERDGERFYLNQKTLKELPL